MSFTPATREQRFVLDHVARIADLAATERFADATPDLIDAVLEGAGAFAAGEWSPLMREGDMNGPKWTESGVVMPKSYPEAYRAYVEGGWGTIGAPADFGGQGLPFVIASAVLETLGSANMGFALAPTLTVGAIEALLHHGTPEQQAAYLPHLASGAWTGTMNLTESQAGSDVGALRARRAGRGWQVPDFGHQDLHLVRRSRHGRKYRPPRSRPHARRARGDAGYFAVSRA